jgi:hypothetical protein
MPAFFEVEVIPPRIIRFCLKNYTRASIDAWAAYIREHDGKLKSPVRVLYDMREAGYPTPYAMSVASGLMQQVQAVEDMRTAYLVKNTIQETFYRLLTMRMPKRIGEVRVFHNEAAAIAWLSDTPK